jgi:uncharacterized protein (TIGR03067 family)
MVALAGGAVVLKLYAGQTDIDRLQGTWELRSEIREGRTVPADELIGMKIIIAGNTLTACADRKATATFSLDASKKPPAIDIHPPGLKGTCRGIYRLERNMLSVCFGGPDHERPTAFASTAGTVTTLWVLRRAKN